MTSQGMAMKKLSKLIKSEVLEIFKFGYEQTFQSLMIKIFKYTKENNPTHVL